MKNIIIIAAWTLLTFAAICAMNNSNIRDPLAGQH